jgi:hypothetical protein
VNGDRIALLALATFVMTSCGEVRTTSPQDAAASKGASSSRPSPVYDASLDDVHSAVLRACVGYFGHVDTDDLSSHVVTVKDFCFWDGGATVNYITLSSLPDGRTMVTIDSQAGSPSGIMVADGTRGEHIIDNLIKRLKVEMEAARPRPTATPTAQPPLTAEERLRRLKMLHDQGLISDDEYASQRAEIVKGL